MGLCRVRRGSARRGVVLFGNQGEARFCLLVSGMAGRCEDWRGRVWISGMGVERHGTVRSGTVWRGRVRCGLARILKGLETALLLIINY